MKGAIFISLFIVLQLVSLPLTISAQSEGDVRLIGPSEYLNLGRLEIFWKGKWSTFCGLSTGGAQAACRQLGYLDFVSYKPLYNVSQDLNITEAGPETPIAIDYTKCERSFSNGLLHVLRCGYSTDLDASCNHSNDIVLQCQTTPLWTHPYETQVRLSDTNTPEISSGTLEIYLNGRWGNVCGSEFNQAAADSACRQIGYTNALRYVSTPEQTADVIWLSDISCQGNNKKSCDCLSGCFDKNPTTPATCSQEGVTHVTCTYNVSIEDKAPSGSQDICENKKSSCDGPSVPGGGNQKKLSNGAVAGIAFVVIVVVVLVIVVAIVLLVAVGLPKWRKRDYASMSKK